MKHDTKSWSDNLSSPSAVTRVSDCVWSRPMAPWPYSNNFHSLNGVCSPVCNGNDAGRNGNRVFGILKGFIIEGLGIHGGR